MALFVTAVFLTPMSTIVAFVTAVFLTPMSTIVALPPLARFSYQIPRTAVS